MGIFKFKSSPRTARPVKEDIEKVLRNGLSGSQMPLFNKLSDQEIHALVDYVVFLSLRGEFERRLIQLSATEWEGETPDAAPDTAPDAAPETGPAQAPDTAQTA